MTKGFRDFILKGNVVDLATAVIIGVAFGAIVDSLVKDVITPLIGMIGGQPDFSSIRIGTVMVGNFLNAVVAFLFKAAGVYFLVVVPFSKFAAKLAAAPAPAPGPSQQELYLKEIRDLLQKR